MRGQAEEMDQEKLTSKMTSTTKHVLRYWSKINIQ